MRKIICLECGTESRTEVKGLGRVVAHIELPEMEELQKAIDNHIALTKQLEKNAMKIRDLQLQINFKLQENQ